MIANLLVFVIVGAFPLFFVKLSVIDSFRVPFRVVTLEVSPDAVSFFVLATGRADVALVILLVGTLHYELECEEPWIVALLASRLEFGRIVHACLEESRQTLKLSSFRLHLSFFD